MKKTTKVRMGMIGGGEGSFIGAVHRMAAFIDGRIELVCGAFSRDADNNARTGAELGLDEPRVYASYQQMISGEAALPSEQRMEFVVVVTPNHLHVPMSIAALEGGFPVFCDKPVGISHAEALELEAVVERTGLQFGLTFTYAGYPMVWQAKHLVAEQKIGKLRKIYVEYPQGWLSDSIEGDSKQAAWRCDPAQAGVSGCIADIGSHAHHLVEFISGSEMVSIAANLERCVEGRVLDDDGMAHFELANGATGVLMASQVCAGEENNLKIRLYGETGGLEWSQMTPNSLIERSSAGQIIHRAGVDKPLCDEALKRCRLPSGHPEGYLEAFGNLYCDFAAAVRGDSSAEVIGIDEGVRSMAFIEGMVESSNVASRISLSDVA